MIMDERTEFADALTLPTPIATANLGDIIDSSVARDLGQNTIYLVIQVSTTVTSGGSSTTQFQIVSDSTTTIAIDGTQTIHYTSFPVPKALLVAGFRMVIPLPAESPEYERYLAVQTVNAVAALTAGAVDAFLTLDPIGHRTYPDAQN